MNDYTHKHTYTYIHCKTNDYKGSTMSVKTLNSNHWIPINQYSINVTVFHLNLSFLRLVKKYVKQSWKNTDPKKEN